MELVKMDVTGCSALMGSEQQLDGDISSYDSLKAIKLKHLTYRRWLIDIQHGINS